MEFTLYHYWRSSASWRVRYALEIKNIKYRPIAVNLLTQEEKAPEYLKLNPNGYLPCLVTQDKYLGESMAILEWLEEMHPRPPILTGDSFFRARIRQFAEIINSGIQPLQNLDVIRKFSEDKTEQKTWSQHWITRGMNACEKLLMSERKSSWSFAFGDHPTMADICLIPQCYGALRFEVDLKKFPILYQIYEHAKTTREFQNSCPEKFQPLA